jgi:hypothetical protein
MPGVRRYDAIISGAGVAGLWLARKLAREAYSILLLEKGPVLAGNASTRNEGWLHDGTYHGAAIPSRDIAVRVARQTRAGFDQTLGFAPEAVEEPSQTFALIKDLDVAEIESRWSDVGVPFERISRGEFACLVPEIRRDGVSAIFRVQDVSINTCVLYAKLLRDAVNHGARMLVNAEIEGFDGMCARIRTPSGSRACEASIFLYAAGFGIKEFFLTRFQKRIDLPLRLWKSHLVDLPRAARHGVFFIDAGEATLMHHKQWTIAGFNSDSIAVSEPNFETVPEKVDAAHEALKRMLYDVNFSRARARACIKVDHDPGADVDVFVSPAGVSYPRPQLGVTFGQPLPGHVWLLPGKMTEAPYVADAVVALIRNQVSPTGRASNVSPRWIPRIAMRPIDSATRTAKCADYRPGGGALNPPSTREDSGMAFDSSALLRASDETRTQHGFLTLQEMADLGRRGNIIFDPLSVFISARTVIGTGNRFFPTVLIESSAPGDLVIGDNNVFFSGCRLLADPGSIRIGNGNQFGEGGCFIKANRPNAQISIGDGGRYLAGVWLFGASTLGSGSQVIGQVHVDDCELEAGETYLHGDPDRRGAVLKGVGDARGLRVSVGHVIRAENGRFQQTDEQPQSIFHPRRRE